MGVLKESIIINYTEGVPANHWVYSVSPSGATSAWSSWWWAGSGCWHWWRASSLSLAGTSTSMRWQHPDKTIIYYIYLIRVLLGITYFSPPFWSPLNFGGRFFALIPCWKWSLQILTRAHHSRANLYIPRRVAGDSDNTYSTLTWCNLTSSLSVSLLYCQLCNHPAVISVNDMGFLLVLLP